jgi:two-component system response regulator DesR
MTVHTMEPQATALTPTELEVLVLAAQGLPLKTIGHRMGGYSWHWANDRFRSIHRKLGVRNRMQAVVKAMRTGLMH